MASAPCAAMEDFISDVFNALIVSAFRRLMIAGGVEAGASKPNHDSISKPGSPASDSVGTSGNRLERLAAVTPGAFSFPFLICIWRALTLEKCIDISPPSTAMVAGGPPLYGT